MHASTRAEPVDGRKEHRFATAPPWMLCAVLVAAYNPWFNYQNLFLAEWTGGGTRAATVSVVWFACMYLVMVRGTGLINRALSPGVAGTSLLILAAAALGFLIGNPARSVGADAFPFVEALMFAILARATFRPSDRLAVDRVLVFLFLWVSATSIAELWLYRRLGVSFESKFVNAQGATLSRLDDFVPGLLVPSALVSCLTTQSRRVQVSAAICVACGTATLLAGFFRSLWIAVAVGLIYVVWHLRSLLRNRRSGRRIAFGILLFAAAVLFAPRAIGVSGSVFEVFKDRVTGSQLASERSVSGRLRANDDIFGEILDHPLGKGLGASYEITRSGRIAPVSSSSNYPLGLILEIGIPGSVVVLLALTRARRSLRRRRVPGNGTGPLIAAAYAVTLFVCVLNFPAVLHFPLLALLSLLMIAAAPPARRSAT